MDSGFKKSSSDKIAFLIIFVLGILIAWTIVQLRHRVSFSEPLELPGSGLSVSAPSGAGWQTSGWEFRNNNFALESRLKLRRDNLVAAGRCEYILAAQDFNSESEFEKNAKDLKGQIVKTGQIQTSGLEIDWAQIERTDQPGAKTYLGFAKLDHGRALKIQIQQQAGEADLAKRIFKQTVNSIKYNANKNLKNGIAIINAVKKSGLASFINDQDQRDFFLVKNFTGNPKGFISSIIKQNIDEQSRKTIQAGSVYQIFDRFSFGENSIFQCDNKYDGFIWVSKTSGSGRIGNMGIELELKNGILSIGTFGGPKRADYFIGPAAVPRVLLGAVVDEMLNAGQQEIIVDLIFSDGRIVPTLIQQIKFEEVAEAEFTVRMDFLNGKNYYEVVYLDKNKDVIKTIVQEKSRYILERKNVDELIKLFPKWADYIIHTEQLLEKPGG